MSFFIFDKFGSADLTGTTFFVLHDSNLSSMLHLSVTEVKILLCMSSVRQVHHSFSKKV